MAPLYRYLAHPSDGILNASGEGIARQSSIPNTRRPNGASNIGARRKSSGSYDFPWDSQLYEKLKAENEEELETFKTEEEEAEEKAGETEVQAARGKRAEFWARVGDQVCVYGHLMYGLLNWLTLLDYVGESSFVIRSRLRKDRYPRHEDRPRSCHHPRSNILR